MIDWKINPAAKREAHFADHNGRRLYVEMTRRSRHAFMNSKTQYQSMIDGVRIGEFDNLDLAKAAAVSRSENQAFGRFKKAHLSA